METQNKVQGLGLVAIALEKARIDAKRNGVEFNGVLPADTLTDLENREAAFVNAMQAKFKRLAHNATLVNRETHATNVSEGFKRLGLDLADLMVGTQKTFVGVKNDKHVKVVITEKGEARLELLNDERVKKVSAYTLLSKFDGNFERYLVDIFNLAEIKSIDSKENRKLLSDARKADVQAYEKTITDIYLSEGVTDAGVIVESLRGTALTKRRQASVMVGMAKKIESGKLTIEPKPVVEQSATVPQLPPQ